MFEITRLTTPFGFEDAETNMLNGFGHDLIGRLRAHSDMLDQYLDGRVLLNQEQLNRIEDIAIETRHLEYIWCEVAKFWVDRAPAFGRVWDGKVAEAVAAVLTRYTHIKEIVRS